MRSKIRSEKRTKAVTIATLPFAIRVSMSFQGVVMTTGAARRAEKMGKKFNSKKCEENAK